jgi:hypothetical protein
VDVKRYACWTDQELANVEAQIQLERETAIVARPPPAPPLTHLEPAWTVYLEGEPVGWRPSEVGAEELLQTELALRAVRAARCQAVGSVGEAPSAGWPARAVAVVLPIATARAMFERAERFDRRSACVLIWSACAAADAERGEPIGGVWMRWHDPTDEQATLWKVEWDPAAGGGEEEVWGAIEVLAGGPVPR